MFRSPSDDIVNKLAGSKMSAGSPYYSNPLVCLPDNPTAIIIHIAKTKTAGRVHPVLFFTPSTIHVLEIVILLDELLRDVLTGLKVNALPGTDTAIDILE